MLHARCTATALILLAFASAASAQGQLVIVTERTKQYHRPWCPVVRDGKQNDIVAMNLGQAELRGFKPHPACESATPPAGAPTGPGATAVQEPQRAIYVFTAAGDTRYHKENCARLPKARKKVRLEDAGKKLWPCSVCRPPVRKRTPAIPKR
jgi:methylphosphotriester-DNA--protein-cysteine methyltransferase